jgi:hypothetical protein
MRDAIEYVIMSKQGLSTAEFTAATTNTITSGAHGLQNGDAVVLTTTNTLPAGLATSTIYYVIEATANTFKLAATPPPREYITGSGGVPDEIDITDTGTGTHTFTEHDIGRNIFCRDHRHAIFSFNTSNSANLTLKFVGAIADSPDNIHDCPDFSATQSNTNAWDYIEVLDLEDGVAIDGDTGISLSGSDDHRLFQANVDALDWINCIFTAWSAGDVTVTVKLYND